MRLLIFAHLIVAFAQAQLSRGLCSVTLRVVNLAGVDQPYSVTTFINEGFGVGSGVDYAKEFQNLRGMVPCDPSVYTVEVDRTNPNERIGSLTRVRGRVAPWHPEVWLTLATNPNLFFAASGLPAGAVTSARPEGYVWTGRITPTPREPLWVHLRSAVPLGTGVGEIQAEVDGKGEFRVYGLFAEGAYILYVMNKQGRIVYLAPVRSETKLAHEPLEITLPIEPPIPLFIR